MKGLLTTLKGLFLVSLPLVVLSGCQNPSVTTGPGPPAAQDNLTIEERWGIKIEGIRLSAAGYMLDFRYRVLDPEKALPLFRRKEKPYLIDEASGAKVMVPNPPKVGPLRQTTVKPEAGRIYFIIFANPGKFIKPGNKVTVVIGDFRAKYLTVE